MRLTVKTRRLIVKCVTVIALALIAGAAASGDMDGLFDLILKALE